MYKLMPVVPLFTLLCVIMVYLVWGNSPTLSTINKSWFFLFGLSLTVVSGVFAIFRRFQYRQAYDLFFVGCLCFWFVYWREVYRIDAPVFSYYPVYFVLLVAVLTHGLVYQYGRMDEIQFKLMRLIYDSVFFHPTFLFVLVIMSVYFREYFIFFPIAVTFSLIRCSFAVIFDELGSKF